MTDSDKVTLLGGRYELGELLGQGGMGRVYRARDTLLDRDVAVKFLSETDLGPEARARMLQEAKAIARLNHPNIVQIHDAGELPPAEAQPIVNSGGTTPFIVMELVEGANLHERPPHGFLQIAQVGRQICTALAHAHAQGIIHRDLKPENVLIAPDGTAKLMDFGLARLGASRVSDEGTIFGTAYYLAPEVALDQPVDARADLYAFGVMLYEMLTGQLPFTGSDPLAVVSQHIHASVVSPRVRNPRVPLVLEGLVLNLLAKSPDDRPASAAVLAERLAVVESLVSVWEVYEPPDGAGAPAGPTGWFTLLRRQRRANRRLIRKQAGRAALGALVALALFGATRPLQVALTAPSDYQETAAVVSLPAWILSGAFALGLVGGGLGLASGLFVGYADAFANSPRFRAQRPAMASLAGLGYAAILILGHFGGLFPAPSAAPNAVIVLDILYGLTVGAALSFLFPVLGTVLSGRDRLKRLALVTLAAWAATAAHVLLTYATYRVLMLVTEFGFALFLILGIGLALRERASRGRLPPGEPAGSEASLRVKG